MEKERKNYQKDNYVEKLKSTITKDGKITQKDINQDEIKRLIQERRLKILDLCLDD